MGADGGRTDADIDRALRRRASAAVAATVRAGAVTYERARHLPRLIRAVPGDYECDDEATSRRLVSRLQKALEIERRRGRARHWAYDMNRHIALMQALEAELGRLRRRQCAGAQP